MKEGCGRELSMRIGGVEDGRGVGREILRPYGMGLWRNIGLGRQ